jgi:membrane-anchored protein YejM (alkaline phosphatase superfamily)
MNFPMSMSDISLWLAVMAIILLLTSELIFSATEYSRNIAIEKSRLRLVALALGIGFMATVFMRIFQPF